MSLPFDGGSSYPLPTNSNEDGRRGKSLRDSFAEKAQIGILANNTLLGSVAANGTPDGLSIYQSLARESYRVADAMLVERAKEI